MLTPEEIKKAFSQANTKTNEPKVYKESEIAAFNEIIKQATELWRQAASEDFEKNGDQGSCIMGDGIGIYYIPKRCRKPQKLLIIPSRRIAAGQGSLHYERTKQIAIDYLKANGLDCYYNYGMMD